MIPKEIKYNLHYEDVRRDFLSAFLVFRLQPVYL